MTSPSWPPQTGLEPTPRQARDLLEQELDRSDYGDPWLESVLRWVLDQLGKLLDGANNLVGGGLSPVVTVLVALAAIALLVWVLPRVRREAGVVRPDGAVLEDLGITSSTYRDLAARARADGRYDDVVLDAFRAIAKDTSDRTLLDDAPGRTAHEISLALAPPFPGQADRLAEAANAFDAVRYGHHRASIQQADAVLELDRELARTRPLLATSPLRNLTV